MGAPVQNFLAVYEKLRDALLEDKVLGNQPAHSKEWLKQVCSSTSNKAVPRNSTSWYSQARIHKMVCRSTGRYAAAQAGMHKQGRANSSYTFPLERNILICHVAFLAHWKSQLAGPLLRYRWKSMKLCSELEFQCRKCKKLSPWS
eukprot:902501-Pelagomonas_calceolata.AAC.1